MVWLLLVATVAITLDLILAVVGWCGVLRSWPRLQSRLHIFLYGKRLFPVVRSGGVTVYYDTMPEWLNAVAAPAA